MTVTFEQRLAFWIRVLLLVCVVLGFLTVVQFHALRVMRQELQGLRDQREQVKAGLSAVWADQVGDEFATAVQTLHDFYVDPADGLGRPHGLCESGAPDGRAIAKWVLGVFAPARVAQQSVTGAMHIMEDALRRSPAYRQAHPK